MLKVLFVSEDLKEHTLLESIFKREFPHVGLLGFKSRKSVLKHLVIDNSFRLIIIECRSHEYDPVDLCREIMDFVSGGCFLFIGTENLLEKTVLNRVNVQRWKFNICKKPYTQMKICKLIENLLTDKEEGETKKIVKVNSKNYFSIGIKNFYLFSVVPYDAFMEVSSDRFVKVISKHELYSQHTIRNLASRNIRKLFIEKTHYICFLEESMESAGNLMFQKDLSPVKILQIQISSVMLVHQYIRNIGVSPIVIKIVEKVINSAADNINSFESFNDILQMFPFEQRDIVERSVLLLYTCEMLIKSQKWNSEITRKQLGLASIIHDCFIRNEELSNISSLDSPEYKQLPDEMKEEFRQHPIRAAELAEQFSGFPNVEFIIEEHHELPDGKGFPYKKKSNKISSISCTFIMGVNFVNHMAIYGINQASIEGIVNHFDKNYNVGFCKQLLKAFEKSIKLL